MYHSLDLNKLPSSALKMKTCHNKLKVIEGTLKAMKLFVFYNVVNKPFIVLHVAGCKCAKNVNSEYFVFEVYDMIYVRS